MPGSYLTRIVGTSWNYRYQDFADPTANENYTVICSGQDTTAFGKNFTIYRTSSTIKSNLYQTATSSEYFHISDIFGIPYEGKYLDEFTPVGSSWQTPVLSTVNDPQGQTYTLTAIVRNTVISRGGAFIINGKNYTDVTNIKVEILDAYIYVAGFNLPITFSVQDVNEFFAPRYGLIKRTNQMVAAITFPGQSPQEIINTNSKLEQMSSSIQ